MMRITNRRARVSPINKNEKVNAMRFIKWLLIIARVAELALAVGFFFQLPWAIALWPLLDTRLLYAFIAAILAGEAAPLLWIGLSGELGALASYGLGFGVMYSGMGIAALRFYGSDQRAPLAWFGIAMCLLAALGLTIFLNLRSSPLDSRPAPRIVRAAFAAEVLVLAGAGTLLVLKVPNTLPWQLSGESSVLYGWVFLGLACYYLYAVLDPRWKQALGPLLGFLVYDLVLFGPLFARYGSVQPEHLRGQLAASAIILFSGALGVYYLFVNKATRLRLLPQSAGRIITLQEK
jgi:hypothetical protein